VHSLHYGLQPVCLFVHQWIYSVGPISVNLSICPVTCVCKYYRNENPDDTGNRSLLWVTVMTASLLYRHNPRSALRSASASANVLSVARSNLVSFGSRAFRAAAPTVWNSLPPHIRSCTTLTTFRKHLKSHLFQSSFTTAYSDPSQRLWFVCDLGAIYIYLLTYIFEVKRSGSQSQLPVPSSLYASQEQRQNN